MASVSRKQRFLDTYDREHATTMKVLRTYPEDRLDLRPHEKLKSARELAWVFALEPGLGSMVFNDAFAEMAGGEPPDPPGAWEELLEGVVAGSADFRDLVASTPDEDLDRTVRFMTGPKTMGEVSPLEWI